MNDNAKQVLNHLNRLTTEQANIKSQSIDRLPAVEICRIINTEDKTVAAAVEKQIENIALTAEMAAETIGNDGRLFYIGAGTSGRLGVLDASEIPPTFGADPATVTGIIAGGHPTLILSKEGIEDKADEAITDLDKFNFSNNDMLIGLAASVKTPYTLAGVRHAIAIGAKSGLIVCNKAENLDIKPNVLIELVVGTEVITGSTRMKSGTAQKMALNMISTTAMVLLGKCYGNLMVDLKATSIKLAARSRKILIELLEIDYEAADSLLVSSEGSVKTAIVMHRLKLTKEAAENKLASTRGSLWKLLDK
ncbi:MAG: N-acetylmuramic acid 6-phosphate etherase [candidate division Zixibacteria bacterium]|nr:N-acetylmuramic acid 6-phosphate etherase [candidate division Zixibacteria bacterium]